MSIPLSEDDALLNDLMLQTDEGKLLHHFGFVPVNTESSTRIFSEKIVILLRQLRLIANENKPHEVSHIINQILPQ